MRYRIVSAALLGLLVSTLATAGEPPRVVDEDERRAPSFADFPRGLLYGVTGGMFSRDNIEPFVIGSTLSLGMVGFDEDLSERFRGEWDDLGDAGAAIGLAGVMGFTGAVLIATPFTDDQHFRSFSFSLSQSILINNVYLYGLKYSVSRTRPNGENDQSFPSGHTSNTFALAEVVNHYYGKWAGIPAYTVAALVGVSRIEKGKHYASDVMFGATLGYLAARAGIRAADRYAGERRWSLAPHLGADEVGLTVSLHF